MKYSVLFFMLWLGVILNVKAQSRTFEDAQRIAASFFCNKTSLKTAPVVDLVMTGDRDGSVSWYGFNNEAGGFVFVGAAENGPEILGYGDEGAIVADRLPDNIAYWLSLYGAEESRNKVGAVKSDIAPLIKTQWKQETPFNNNCVRIFDNPSVTGCVPIAMAQVMYYYQWPKVGNGTHKYSFRLNVGGSIETFKPSAHFGETHYDWSNIKQDYGSGYTTLQAQAVAQLVYHCGVSVNTEYAGAGSSASISDIPYAFNRYFGYSDDIEYVDRKDYNDAEWHDVIYNELKESRPVIYSGQAPEGGHAFIIDGYKNGNYHVNWGWGGYLDGYFTIDGTTALKPDDESYAADQTAVIGIYPAAEGVYGDIIAIQCAEAYSASLSDNTLTFSGKFVNMTSESLTIYNYTVFDYTDGTFMTTSGSNRTIVSGDYVTGYSVNCSIIADGEYVVIPGFKYKDAKNYLHVIETIEVDDQLPVVIRIEQGVVTLVEAGGSSLGPTPIVDVREDRDIRVVGNRIIVEGAQDYRIFDMQGRSITETSELARGIYIVVVDGKSYKVFIK